ATVDGNSTIAPEKLAAIKRATVFVKVNVKDLTMSGSGFVMKVDGDTALVVTNHHVIEPKVEIEVPARSAPPSRLPPRPPTSRSPPRPTRQPQNLTPRSVVVTFKDATVNVVFDSGTGSERSAKAEILSADPERDLAVLRVKGVKDVPPPIDFAKAAALAET